MTQAGEESICGVKSIVSGEIKRQPSWSDFNSLINRIETLEQERRDEALPLVNASDDGIADVDDFNDDDAVSLPSSFRRSSRQRIKRMLMMMPRRGRTFDNEIEEVEHRFDYFEFPESTFTFLVAEPIFSTPFAAGCVSYAMSLTCLILALKNELDNGTDDNPHGVAEVTRNVRATQFLGIIIGVLMGKLDYISLILFHFPHHIMTNV